MLLDRLLRRELGEDVVKKVENLGLGSFDNWKRSLLLLLLESPRGKRKQILNLAFKNFDGWNETWLNDLLKEPPTEVSNLKEEYKEKLEKMSTDAEERMNDIEQEIEKANESLEQIENYKIYKLTYEDYQRKEAAGKVHKEDYSYRTAESQYKTLMDKAEVKNLLEKLRELEQEKQKIIDERVKEEANVKVEHELKLNKIREKTKWVSVEVIPRSWAATIRSDVAPYLEFFKRNGYDIEGYKSKLQEFLQNLIDARNIEPKNAEEMRKELDKVMAL